jgi:hypothetical protein
MTIIQSCDSLMTDQSLLKCDGDIPKIIAEKASQEGVVPQEKVRGQSFAHSRTRLSCCLYLLEGQGLEYAL